MIGFISLLSPRLDKESVWLLNESQRVSLDWAITFEPDGSHWLECVAGMARRTLLSCLGYVGVL